MIAWDPRGKHVRIVSGARASGSTTASRLQGETVEVIPYRALGSIQAG